MFKIGEFSKIAQVSARQLRRYDEMGLLTPLHVDRFTGYRFYSATQLPRLNRILALKELGLTLAQIGQYLNQDVTTDELRGMLALKRSQLEQELEREAARLRYIESRIAQIDQHGRFEQEVVLKSVPDQSFLSVRDRFPTMMDGFMLMAKMRQRLSEPQAEKVSGFYTAVFHSDMYDENEADIEIGLLLNSPIETSIQLTDRHQLTLRELSGSAEMLTTVRIGAPQLGHGSFAALGVWLEANGYQIVGPGREMFINFPPVGHAHDAVAEIQFPVEKVG